MKQNCSENCHFNDRTTGEGGPSNHRKLEEGHCGGIIAGKIYPRDNRLQGFLYARNSASLPLKEDLNRLGQEKNEIKRKQKIKG